MLTIRDALFSDLYSIARLHAENWQQNYRGIYSDAFLNNEVEQERTACWEERLRSPKANQHVLVAMLNATLSGFACLFLDDDPMFGSYLDNLHVSGSAQGTGVGRHLLRECAYRVLNNSAGTGLYLWVYEANKAARDVYEHLGAANAETVEKETKDGLKAKTCRYVWQDVSVLAG